ncbi:MAG: hypothetical protein IT459_19465 [Planctomycetes bacterium]|nr:hypothetical protein [Planctomycetota bacterium]
MLNRRSVRFVLLLSGVLGVFVVVLLVQEQSIFGKRRRFSPPADANASTSSPLTSSSERADGGASSLAVQGARIIAMETLEETGEKVKKYSIVIGETIGAVAKRTRARNVEVQIFNKKPGSEERVVAIVRGDEAAITFVEAPDVAGGFSGSEIEALLLQSNVVVDYLDEAGKRAAKLTTDELQIEGLTMNTYVPRRAFIDQEGMHIEGDGLRYSKARGAFSFERNVLVEGSAFRLPSSDPNATADDDTTDAAVRRITSAGAFDYVPSATAIDDGVRSETSNPALKSGVLTFREDVVGSQDGTTLNCAVLEITLDNSKPADDEPSGEGGGTRITKVVATGTRDRPSKLVDGRGTFIAEVLSMEKVELGDVLVLKNDARIENARFGTPGTDTTASTEGATDLLNAAAKTLIRVEPLAAETEDAPERMKILLRDAAFLALESPTPERSFRIDGEEIDLFVVRETDDEGAEQMKLERLNSRLRARGEFAQGSFTADDIAVRPKVGATDPSDFEIELRPNPRIDLTRDESAGVERQIVVVGTDCVAVIAPPAVEGAPIRAHFEGKNVLTVDENGARSLTMNAARSLTIDAPGKGSGGTKVTAIGGVSFASELKGVNGDGETVELQILEDESQKVSILAAPAGPLARVTLVDEARVGNEIRARRIDFDPNTNVLEADGAVHAVVPSKLLVVSADGTDSADATDAPKEPGTLDSDHLVVRMPRKDEATGETPKTLVLEATGRARYSNPAEGIVATGHRLVFDQATALATVYGNDEEDALVLRSSSDPKVKVQERLGVGGNVVILHQDTKSLDCPDRGSVVIMQPVDAQDPDTDFRTMNARSAGPVRFADDRLLLRQNVVVTFEQAGIEDRAMHCDKLTVTFAKRDDGQDAADLTGSAPAIERILAEGRVLIEQAGERPLRAGGDVAEWLPGKNDNFIELRAPAPLCWAEMDGPNDFVRYDGTSVKIRLDSQDVSTGPGEYEKISKAKL